MINWKSLFTGNYVCAYDSSEYKKLDLHIHTPHSVCYSDMSVTPEQIVEAAKVFGLDAIGITDHNGVDNVDIMRNAAAKEGLTVFPGIELTTKSGHFLAVFDIDATVRQIDKLLDDIGVLGGQRGDAQVNIPLETEDIFKTVINNGGLVVAAHIERWPSGFLETNLTRAAKMEIHASRYLSALEITIARNREQWENGLMRGYPKKYACIQGSDAHSPLEVGRRSFLVRMDRIGLAGLRDAFVNWDNKIVFPDEFVD